MRVTDFARWMEKASAQSWPSSMTGKEEEMSLRICFRFRTEAP